MHPQLLKALLLGFSAKDLLKYILFLCISILILPIIVVCVLANTGIQTVSDSLVSSSKTTQTIAIHDPTGKHTTYITTRTTWPVHGTVTLEFGESDLPYQLAHTGIDIANNLGDPITPFMQGTVVAVEHLSWGYGNYVMIDHGNHITSLYGHMSKTSTVIGTTVRPGDIIGYEGQSGWATGPHLHFEIRVFGIPVNPRTFIADDP